MSVPVLGPEESPASRYDGVHLPLVVVSAITLFLSVASVGARTYTRAVIMRQFDVTDWVLLLTAALFIAFVSMTLAVPPDNAPLFINIIEILYCPTMFCAKYVVLRQIELIFCDHRRQALEFKATRILIWINLLFYTATALLLILACIPRAKISDSSLPGNCIDVHAGIIGTSAVNVASDFVILITPIAAIWRLRMPANKKIGVAAVFGVGVIALVASIFRLETSIRLTSSIIPFIAWVLGELNAVILVACFPYFPRLYDHMSNKTQSPRRIPSNDSPPMVPNTSAFAPRDLSPGVGMIA